MVIPFLFLSAVPFEFPDSLSPLDEFFLGDIVNSRAFHPSPRMLKKHDDKFGWRYDHRGLSAAPGSSDMLMFTGWLLPDYGGFVFPSHLLSNLGNIGGQGRFDILVVVYGDIQTHPAGTFGKSITFAEPLFREFEVGRMSQIIVVGVIGDSYIVRGRGDNQIHTQWLNLIGGPNVIRNDSDFGFGALNWCNCVCHLDFLSVNRKGRAKFDSLNTAFLSA